MYTLCQRERARKYEQKPVPKAAAASTMPSKIHHLTIFHQKSPRRLLSKAEYITSRVQNIWLLQFYRHEAFIYGAHTVR